MGQETEYAIRFSPKLGHPGNDRIYGFLAQAIGRHVRTAPGLYPGRPQIFMQNGGGFHYEYRPHRVGDGLIEGATPECRGPGQLLLYQKAQEALLMKVIPARETSLSEQGFPGKLGLLKNCRDARGNVYGAQESFQVSVASGLSLVAYRLGLAALLPLLALTVVLGWLVIFVALVALAVAVAGGVVVALPPFRRRRWLERLMDFEEKNVKSALGRMREPLDPVAALHTLVSDPALEAVVNTNQAELTALQRFYLDKAKAFVKESKATSLEASEVVNLWDEVLSALEERKMDKLVGRVDWVTKRYLLEACGDEGDAAMLKTIDLRYHELGEGYAEQFAETGNVHRLLAPSEVERAIEEPPEGTPAYKRGRFIRSRAANLTPVRISWDSALIGGRIKGKIIRFPDRGGPTE